MTLSYLFIHQPFQSFNISMFGDSEMANSSPKGDQGSEWEELGPYK